MVSVSRLTDVICLFLPVQPGPDSIGIVAISHGCTGVAARACGLVGLDPTRVSRPAVVLCSWLRQELTENF